MEEVKKKQAVSLSEVKELLKNQDPKNIPCHRVIRSDGSIGGYSLQGGINKKKYLLIKEKKCSKI